VPEVGRDTSSRWSMSADVLYDISRQGLRRRGLARAAGRNWVSATMPRQLRHDFDNAEKRRIPWPILCLLAVSAGFIAFYIVLQIAITMSNAP
jgi:hypothetical protein